MSQGTQNVIIASTLAPELSNEEVRNSLVIIDGSANAVDIVLPSYPPIDAEVSFAVSSAANANSISSPIDPIDGVLGAIALAAVGDIRTLRYTNKSGYKGWYTTARYSAA